MVYVLGFDVSKNKVDVSLIDQQGVEQWTDKVPNTTADIAALLLGLVGNYPNDELCCVVESTGIYHRSVTEAAIGVSMPCRVYDPIITRQQIKATVRGTKTDRTDALMIARLGLRGEGRLHTPEPYMTAKYYARGQQKLTQLAGALDKYQKHLSAAVDNELSDTLTAALGQAHDGLLAVKKVLATETATSCPSQLNDLLQSMPGIGPYIAASLIGEIQTMERFKTAKALIAYAGLDPKIRQSGHTLSSTGRLTKRGSPYLRCNLFIAANVARQHDPNLKALYDKKRSEGKSYTVAVIVVARKLLAIIRAVWLSGEKYTADFKKSA